MTPLKTGIALALAAAAFTGFSLPAAVLAAPATAMHGKKTAAKTVYICKDCKAYYSPAMAKKMGYKDSMGHTLTKMSQAPAGYMNGSAAKM